MRCNKGDLAIVVSSMKPDSPNIGKIVRCLELMPYDDFYKDGAIWRVDVELELYNIDTGELWKTDKLSADKNMIPLNHKLEDVSEEQIKEIINE